MLDLLKSEGFDVISIGKIFDLFAGREADPLLVGERVSRQDLQQCDFHGALLLCAMGESCQLSASSACRER